MPAKDGAPCVDHEVAERLLTSVTIDLHRREDPIGGIVRDGAHPPEHFRGWTGLLAAMQAAFAPPPR